MTKAAQVPRDGVKKYGVGFLIFFIMELHLSVEEVLFPGA